MKKITFLFTFFLTLFAWNSSAQIGSYPYVENFESGDGGWTVDDPTAGSWELGTPANTIINSADTGTNAWVTNLTGDYASDEDVSVVSPVFDFSSLTAPSIEFSLWWNTEFSWDGMVLQSSIDDGTSWQNIGDLGDPNNWYNDGTIAGNPGGQAIGWTGRGATGSGGWVIARHALIGLGGQSNVLLRFAFASDGSVQDEGVGFDSVNVFDVSCLEPLGITVNNITNISAEITWLAGGTESDWEIVVQLAGTGAPTGPGTATTNNNPYDVSGLTESTDYEVYVRSDCNGEFSSWVGPINFSTTAQLNFTVDCAVGPVNTNFCYFNDIDDDPSVATFTYTSSDGSPLSITFNQGQMEGCCDELVVIDSDGTELFNANQADVSGLFFQSSGDTISWYINSDFSVSCESSGYTPFDVTVACATCVNPEATYSVVSNCAVGPEFFVDVDVTNLGSATSITISDDQGGAPQTVSATGIVSFGPYPNTTPVVMTVINDNDFNCELTSTVLTQDVCFDNVVDCAVGPVNTNFCYFDDIDDDPSVATFTYTSSNGLPLNLTFNQGQLEGCCDELVVIDSDGSELFNDNLTDVSGLTFQSSGDTISWYINSDFSINCEGNNFTPFDVTVACATCINPAATYQVVDDCANGNQFLVDVNVTTLGDATSLTISNNIDANTVTASAVGTYQVGPFPFLVDVVITLSNDQDPNCVINSSAIQLLACPPDNDNPCNATIAAVNTDSSCDLITSGSLVEATPSGVPVGTCTGNPDDDVWFEFVAEDETQVISIINIQGGTFNIDHGVYEGACDGLTELFCSDDVFSFDEITYVVGNTYYIRIFSGGSNSETSTFDLCIRSAPENIDCENADNPCISSGTDVFIFPSVVGIEQDIDVACLNDTPNPSWFEFEVGESGTIEFQIEQWENFDDMGNPVGDDLDVDFVLWGPFDESVDYCALGLETECACPNNTTNPNFYPFGNIVDCSWDAAATENFTIDNAVAGEIYVLLVSNWSRDPGFIQIAQTNNDGGFFTAEIDVDLGQDQELCGFPSYDIIASSPFADRFEWYCDGFIIPGEIDSTLTVTESCTYTVIAFDDGCGGQAQDEITITFGAEPVANPVADIVTCDDASADEIENFDLEIQTATLLGSQDPTDFNVTYHLTLAEAQQGIGSLGSPYTNTSNPQTIFVRIEDANATFCFVTTTFDLIISGPTPTVNSVLYSECDDDFDGVTLFDLASQDANVLGSQSATEFTVSYYETQVDAVNGMSAIDTSSLYSSTTTIIFVRVESNIAFDCFSTATMELVVNPLPDTTFSVDFDYEVCPNATNPIQIVATANNYDESDVTINWYFDGGLVTGENSLTLPVIDAGLYEIEVINNQTQCFSITEQIVIELPTCVIPQGISPNGDGNNDVFDLSSFGVTKLEIFNRNGTLVYSKKNYRDEWHGQTDDGDELPVGTYFYTMEYENGKQRAAWVYIQRVN